MSLRVVTTVKGNEIFAFVGVAREVKRVDSPTNKKNMECPAPAFPFAAESRLGLRVYSSLN